MSVIPDDLMEYPEIHLPAQQTVFSQGQACTHYIVLTQGQVRVFARSRDGKEVVLYRIRPGEICLLTTACLMGDDCYSAEAVTESPASARVIPPEHFHQLLSTSESFRQFVFNNFGARLTQLMIQLEHIAFDSIEQRLHQYLWQMSATSSVITATHQDIATEIGSAREVVSRSLKKMEKRRLIKLHRGTIEVLQRPALLQETRDMAERQ